MSNLIPVPLEREQLADLLRDMADRIESGDSDEGHIEYLINYDDEIDPRRLVSGAYRIGNLYGGQGGMRIIGSVPGPSPEGTDERA